MNGADRLNADLAQVAAAADAIDGTGGPADGAATPAGPPPRVALIGANGHGLWHRRRIAPLHEAGRVDLVALVDVRDVAPADGAPIPDGTAVLTDHRELLSAYSPDVAVICTPPHTHLAIASDCLRAGADVLLEKPPVVNVADHQALASVVAETGRALQVGFQALGSVALARLRAAVDSGELGTLTGVSVVGSWQRSDAYYARSPWAGRRSVGGHPVLDGALANPFAHAVMQALAVAGSEPTLVELDAYRTREIEVDDTATLRVTLASGVRILVAVTLCGEDFLPGMLTAVGTTGTARLEYPTDRLAMPGDAGLRDVPGRVGLLENLLDHRADPDGVPLLAPLADTLPFTVVLEAIRAAGVPPRVDPAFVTVTGDAPEIHHTIPGINDTLLRAGRDLALLRELAVPWARDQS
ncbi:Gfo/Idh/MocA family oxidoreductase [Luedemannella helvata]|uniref:Gfo/Idh/MocA family oxidoreductase n=1 Tax=Luedemannella helvata TaxID=349315 RepID=A0ABP4XBG4_9ACTN